MSGYSAHRYWSPMLGCDAVRLSMVDDRGGEFFKIIPVDAPGQPYRTARDAALDAIENAIAAGAQPGEVE